MVLEMFTVKAVVYFYFLHTDPNENVPSFNSVAAMFISHERISLILQLFDLYNSHAHLPILR